MIKTDSVELSSDSKLKELRNLVKYVKSNNDFYVHLYDDVNEDEFTLKQLPLLKRNHIRNNLSSIISRDFCIDELRKETTYGTTEGIPLSIYKSNMERMELGISLWKQRRMLNNEACKRHAHYYYNTSNPNAVAQIESGSDSVDILFPVIKRSEVEYIDDLQTMIDFDVKWLICSPTIALKLAQLAVKYNVSIKLEMVEFLSEYVPSFYKKYVEKVFACDTCIEYGCHETWGIAFTDKEGKLTAMNNIILEKNPDDRFLNGYGQCVVTNLKLRSLPFIRYELRDLVDIKGNELRTYGFRASDMVIIGEYKIHCSFFSNLFENNSSYNLYPLEDYQIIYNDKVICICLYNCCDKAFGEMILEYLEKKLVESYGLNIQVRVKNVTSFLTDTFTGKMRGIIKYKDAELL